jgi:transposase-like protein
MPNCPICVSAGSVKNGHIHNGKQRYLCRVCSRQFVENPQQQEVSADKKALIDRLLLERLSMAGICRAVGVSERWLQTYVNKKISHREERFS